MSKVTFFAKRINFVFISAMTGMFLIALLFVPNFTLYKSEGENRFEVYLYGHLVGCVDNKESVDEMITQARRELATDCDHLYMVDYPEVEFVGSEVVFGKCDSKSVVFDNIKNALSEHEKNLCMAYTVKVNNTLVNLQDIDEVRELLGSTLAVYDEEGKYELNLDVDRERAINVLTASVEDKSAKRENVNSAGGIEQVFDLADAASDEVIERKLDEYELGLRYLGFSEQVEIAESYISMEDIDDYETAKNTLTALQEVQQIYEVQPGDTLSGISLQVGIPMEDIVEMNKDYLDNVNSVIHVGQGLIITVPEPELSVISTQRLHYDETYEEEIIYVDNDEWYTTKQVTLQEPSAGYREVVADITYENDEEIKREIVSQVIGMEAVPKIVERGTIIPPTYIKPISGGRLSSGFGKRKAPKKGASTYHKGVDWATPVGTPVYASSGGTVAKAGWGSGYGYVIYIDHPDGRQTRYGHLSKLLVSAGSTVNQGDKIALSGNTGVSTGAHLHFEILINGSQVNPLNYLD